MKFPHCDSATATATVWNYGNFLATQILGEINFCVSGVSKCAILTVSVPLKFDFSYLLHFGRAEIDEKSKFRGSENEKIPVF